MENNKIDSVLGQRVSYPQHYDPSVLVRVERQLNRAGLGLQDEALPFMGYDIWHAYEVSCLNNWGLPTAGVMKIVIPCTSKYIVESKSLKLYLNSYNMEPMGTDGYRANEAMAKRVQKDLSDLLETDVKVHVFGPETEMRPIRSENYITLEDQFPVLLGEIPPITHYTETPELLKVTEFEAEQRMMVKSHLLRSNCRVTHQPDWGTIFIRLEGKRIPNPYELLAYIVSLRGENHFHEEICELIFCRLQEIVKPKDLCVTCFYTRRGGIDINPTRSTKIDWIPGPLTFEDLLEQKLARN